MLDVGSGPGLLAAEMAAEVGPGGRVVGVDPSESMLALARGRTDAAEFVAGGALELPVPDASFDVVVSTQVLEYVEDVAGALAEARRVLRPGGRLLVLDTDWDSIVWQHGRPRAACGACWPPGRSTSPTRTSRAGCRGSCGTPGSR